MELTGWLASVAVLTVFSVPAFIIGLLTFGKHTVGGALNSWPDRVFMLIVWAFVAWLWWSLMNAAPFALTMKGAAP